VWKIEEKCLEKQEKKEMTMDTKNGEKIKKAKKKKQERRRMKKGKKKGREQIIEGSKVLSRYIE